MLSDGAGRHFIFPNRNADVVATVDDNDTVTAYAVTLNASGFHPLIKFNHPKSVPHVRVRLGVSTFATLGTPDEVSGGLGISAWNYRELHSAGRPAGFRYYVFGSHELSGIADPVELLAVLRGYLPGVLNVRRGDERLCDPSYTEARSRTVVTRYAVTSPFDPSGWEGL
jgi:hypothetical protein